MSDIDKTSAAGPGDGDAQQSPGEQHAAGGPEGTGEQPDRPRRVIGTPSPATARTLLEPAGDGSGHSPAVPETATQPEDEAKAKRAERIVAAFFLLSMLASIGFIAAYVGMPVHTLPRTFHSNLALGTAMTVGFLSMAAGAVIWVRRLMPEVDLEEPRKPVASTQEDRQAFQETFMQGGQDSGFIKRPLVRRTLIAATLPLALAPIVLLRDLGPLPGTSLRHTVWRKGMRLLVYGSNRPIKPEDFNSPGGLITVVPDGYQDDDDALAKAAAILIRFEPGQLQKPTVMDWTVQNIVAYSKICTHVGCPVALYEQTTQHILCPCHQSTFDAPRGATVIFGPAPRPLPQLPLTTDAEGYLVAAGDFNEPVGPSFWERG
ncbi:MAG TPA: Rieske 2Fe-2S domain-containing protein [Streptosporangiaceae bacterium]